ncbi:MAG TPA: lysophospholipid acyltransferase family protein [Xanthobacteraceae bacterium]|nr:lysophospholipid acyltransferase family protein [Xanthobacteraceae bacterium]
MNMLGTLFRKSWMQASVGVLAAEYLRLVRLSNTFQVDPPDIYDRINADLPVIFAMWHGQHFMAPFFKHERWRVKSLISRHRDGAINAVAAQRLGIEPIRGSGSHGRDFHRKGGVTGFRRMVEALADGCNVALTADVPKVSRVVGRGIIELARVSGRPIYPVIPATSRRIQLENWDRSAVSLPFGRFAVAIGEPLRVAADAEPAAIETARRTLEARLASTFERAYAIVDGRANVAERSQDRLRRARTA